MNSVRICIPWGHDFETAKSGLRELKQKGEKRNHDIYTYKGYIFDIEPRQGSPDMATNRNNLLTDGGRTVLKEYEWFFFVDSDIEWKIESLIKLLKHNVDLCCAPYLRRSGLEYCCGRWEQDYMGKVSRTAETGFKRIDFTGAGFLLINRNALKRMSYPYFRNILYKHPEGGLDQLSEDYSFCAMAKDAGIQLWCDFDINIVHKPKTPVPEDWEI